MTRRGVPFVVLSLAVAYPAAAEDPRERAYHVPVLRPKHRDKPKVAGWARQRVNERLNRGVVAVPTGEGRVYVGWRLLNSDGKKTAFNVYRSVDDADPARLNTTPVSATTDFIDKRPILGRHCAYWVRAVVDGRELEASERAVLKAGARGATSFQRRAM